MKSNDAAHQPRLNHLINDLTHDNRGGQKFQTSPRILNADPKDYRTVLSLSGPVSTMTTAIVTAQTTTRRHMRLRRRFPFGLLRR